MFGGTLTEEEANALLGWTPEQLEHEVRPFEDGTWVDDDGTPIHLEGPVYQRVVVCPPRGAGSAKELVFAETCPTAAEVADQAAS